MVDECKIEKDYNCKVYKCFTRCYLKITLIFTFLVACCYCVKCITDNNSNEDGNNNNNYYYNGKMYLTVEPPF